MDTFAIRGLSFSYPEAEQRALSEISLTVHEGEFLTLCGPSGCGKSTLLRQMKTVLTPHGQRTGAVLFEGEALSDVDQRTQSAKIGYVLQSPENQIVTDKVWHELAFGLESLGFDTPTIRRRVAEMASFFGIEDWFYKNVTELSGGQKQLLNLASIMAMQPSVLILDEPTSQLDPIAAVDFLGTIGRINRELGTTIILTEHRLEDAFPMSTRVAVMDGGRMLCEGTPQEVGARLRERGHAMFLAMPSAMRIWAGVPNNRPCPVTVRDGRAWLTEYAAHHALGEIQAQDIPAHGEIAAAVEDVWFKYEKDLPDVVRGLSVKAYRGELLAILGGNGAGKTTSLGIIAGLKRVYRGRVEVFGKIGTLPQHPQTLFVKKTVREDLFEIFRGSSMRKLEQETRVARVVQLCRLEELLERHPYDLSGGEQQRAALAKVLLLEPEILLLDEPTKGLDAEYKQVFAQILRALLRRGVAMIMVSHDVEFCAKYAHRCALFFDGSIVAEGPPRVFFSGNSFYTTAANRMARRVLPDAVTPEDVIAACGGVPPAEPELPDDNGVLPPPDESSAHAPPQKLPWWRKLLAMVSGLIAVAAFLVTVRAVDLSEVLTMDGIMPSGNGHLMVLGVFVIAVLIFALSIARKSRPPKEVLQLPRENRKLSKRTVAAAVVILLLVPLTLFIGSYYLGDRKYYFISILVILEIMLPFVMVFEGRKPQARELVVIAVLCAIGVAGRAAFFMLPNFKPVMAVVIISGIAFGGETGFLVGAATMLVSNILFGQGPWTPFQMFAMGIIGFLAGLLFRKGLLLRSRGAMCVYGTIAAVVVYGGIMNPVSALLWVRSLEWKTLLAYYISGFPFDLIQAAATVFFLLIAAEPMLEKLDRIKVKYGLVE
ncbi:MAG: ATP-binding cassette domain-containing protein [Oscillospiraceae bacterium]|nr:ATP-binding cassette domain-containing protein [Oscillospiraceae bacterium]